jgi:hypothetical protein
MRWRRPLSYSETALLIVVCCASAVFVVVTTVGGIVAKHWGSDDE